MLPNTFFPTDFRCHGNKIWDEMGYDSACVQDFCEIFASIKGFRERAIECCQSHFFPTDFRCHGNEIWDEMGYNSACVRDYCEIFAPIGRYLKTGIRMLPIAFFPDRLPLPWQRNLKHNGL